MQKSSCGNNTSEISISQIINAPDEVVEVNDSVNYTRSNPTTDVNVAISILVFPTMVFKGLIVKVNLRLN